MAGKKKQVEEQDGSWVAEVEKYSRQIWLAGLGAYAKAGKEGVKLFDALIKDGEAAEKAAKTELDKQIKVLKGKKSPLDNAKGKADKALGKLSGRWAELEEAFDKRMNSAVSRLGVPSRDEVQQLSARVDELAGLIAGLKKTEAKPKVAPKAVPTAAKVAPAAPAASKPAAKAAAPKPAAAAKPAASKPKAPAKPRAPRAPAKPKTAAPAAPAATPVAAPKPETPAAE